MRSSAYYLYIDLFVFGRYIAFVAGFVVLAGTILSLVLCLLVLLRPLPVPHAPVALRSIAQPAVSSLTVAERDSKPAAPRNQLVRLAASPAITIPMALLVHTALILFTRRQPRAVPRVRHSATGPPARSTIPIAEAVQFDFARNYLSAFVPAADCPDRSTLCSGDPP